MDSRVAMETVPGLPKMHVSQADLGPRSRTLVGGPRKPRAVAMGPGARAPGIDTLGTSFGGRVGLRPEIHGGYGEQGLSQRHLEEGRLRLAGLKGTGGPTPKGRVWAPPLSVVSSREGAHNFTGSLGNLSNVGNTSNHGNQGRLGLTRSLSNLSMRSINMSFSNDLRPSEGSVRRSENLPPLSVRERSLFARNKSPFNDTYDRHWNIPPPRNPSLLTDRKIVNHLRRKLNRRVEKRINKLLENELDIPDDDSSDDQNEAMTRTSSPFDVFSSYNEYGEKVERPVHTSDNRPPSMKTRTVTKSPSKKGPQDKVISTLTHGMGSYMFSEEASAPSPVLPSQLPTATTPLPAIPSAKEDDNEEKSEPPPLDEPAPAGPSDRKVERATGEELVQKQEDGVVFALTGRENTAAPPTDSTNLPQTTAPIDTITESPEGLTGNTPEERLEVTELGMQMMNKIPAIVPDIEIPDEAGQEEVEPPPISPVATPMLFRPDTRHEHMLGEERVSKVMSGDLNARCQPKSKVFRIFLHSAGPDSEVERSALFSKVYPRLRDYCHVRGYDLQLIDPNLGTRELLVDDHSEAMTSLALLERAQQDTKGLHFVTFVADKYGEVKLPATIPAEELDAILDKMTKDHDLEVTRAREEATKLAAAAEEERRKGEERKLASLQKGDSGAPNVKNNNNSASLLTVPNQTGSDGRHSAVSTPESDAASTKSPSIMAKVRKAASKVGKDETETEAESELQGAAILRAMRPRTSHDHGADPALVKNWYQLDKNANPPQYRLANISVHHRDVLSKDSGRRSAARSVWFQTSRRLLRMLLTYAQKCFTDPDVIRRYTTSLSDESLENGLFHTYEDPNLNSFWFRRNFEGADGSVGDPGVHDYYDIRYMEMAFDTEARDQQKRLTSKIKNKLSPRNTKEYLVNWHQDGVSTAAVRSHMVYVDTLCKDFTALVIKDIDGYMQEAEEAPEYGNHLFHEIEQHVDCFMEKSARFQGRKQLLSAIKTHMRSGVQLPLVLHGKSGCGLTALISKAARDASKWLRLPAATIVRAIGMTANSTHIRLLLKGICQQVAHIQQSDLSSIPEDYKGLMNYLVYQLSLATENKPILIFLDSLHKLANENDARKLAWLPSDLPPHAHIIVSTLSDDKYDCFKHLKRAFKKSNNMLEVGAMPVEDADLILEHWYKYEGRKVTSEQFNFLLETFSKNPQPLYLRLIYLESLRWGSHVQVSDINLGAAIKNVAMLVFGRWEVVHGEPLVRRALGYITASRAGVTETEMEDLLSLDEAVMDDVCAKCKPRLRRVPPVMWQRLKLDMAEYVRETAADECATLVWTFQQFHEAAVERYLIQRDKAPSYHKALAEYFQDTWYEEPKPYPGNETGVERHVAAQPLSRELPTTAGSSTTVYNFRRLNEVPFHLLNSQQFMELKRDCLLNFEFCLAKLTAFGLKSVYEDLQMALAVEPSDPDIRLLSDTLQLSSNALEGDPRQLASQVIGRLMDIIKSDTPRAPQDPVKYPFVQRFFAQAKNSSVPTLVPSMTCLTPPGGILFDLLSGHTQPITAVVMTPDGQRTVTSSRDNSMKVWELRTGRVTRTIPGVGRDVFQIRLGLDNTVAVTSETPRCGNLLRVWCLKTGSCLRIIDEYDDPAAITTAGEGAYLCAFFHGRLMMRTWSLKDEIKLIREQSLLEEDNTPIHKDETTIVAHNSAGTVILHAFRSTNQAVSRDAVSGAVRHRLKVKESGSITALACSREYYILACKYQYKEIHELCLLELFDIKNGKYVRGVRGCVSDRVQELFVNNLGSHALAICSSEATNQSSISIWNIETEDHKHLAKHSKVSVFGACVDLRYCLTAPKNEDNLCIWNLSGKVNAPAPREKAREGIEAIVPMVDHARYVVARSLNNGPLAVWNVIKGRCQGKAVRIERGMSDPSDTILVRNTKVYILADKGYPDGMNDSGTVYKQLYIYDLKAKKYTHKLKDIFIVPCPEHEYVLLDDWHLLGLSDNRTHFIVWDLKKGRVAYRIKSTFKDQKTPRKYGDKQKDKDNVVIKPRGNTAKMTPWDRRQETQSARHRRHLAEAEEDYRKAETLSQEKENGIAQYLLSDDQTTIVASYFAHHLTVFDIETRSHLATLQNPDSMLHLYISSLSSSGSHLVHTNYDDVTKTSYVTVWDCRSGRVRKRLRNERDVCAVAVTDDGDRVVMGRKGGEMRIWEPGHAEKVRRIQGYPGLEWGVGSRIHVTGGSRVVVVAGAVSVWDLARGEVLAVFTPDQPLGPVHLALGGQLVVFGLMETPDVVTLRLCSRDTGTVERIGQDMFGEAPSSSEESDFEDTETMSKFSSNQSSKKS